jgi:hypothetical protein
MSTRFLMTLSSVLVAVAVVPAAASNVIYVDVNADQAPHDGSDWCHALVTLHEALSAATPDTEIRIADGVYVPDTAGLTDPREASFVLLADVTLKGGFAGCGAANPNAHDPAAYETILSGDIGAPNQTADNCYHVLRGTGIDADTVIDGVTITRGNANGTSAHRQGGGMMLAGASPTVRHCVFRENHAEFGGGMFNSGGHPSFTATRFDANSAAGSGGGAYNYGTMSDPPASYRRCTFMDNTAAGDAGALRNYDCRVELRDCFLEGNLARYDGGAVANGGATVATFTRCRFEQNRADTLFALHDAFGGAMQNTDTSAVTLVSCAFRLNVANATLPGISYGGALAQTGTVSLTLDHCSIAGNQANIGKALYAGGSGTLAITNSILHEGSDEIAIAGPLVFDIAYSATTGLWSGVGNIDADPLLDDLRLQPGSPCINTGDPAYIPAPGEQDLDGHARVLCERVEMGAFEFGIGDVDCDQMVSAADFLYWEDCLTGPDFGPYPAGCAAFDYEYDDDVDLTDLAAFQAAFDPAP